MSRSVSVELFVPPAAVRAPGGLSNEYYDSG